MLDRKFVIENANAVLQNCTNRNVSSDVGKIVELEKQRREKLQEAEKLNAEANATSKKIGGAKDDAERESLKEGARQLRADKDAAQKAHDELDAKIREIELTIPNMAHPDCPVGVDDKSNLELGRGKHEPREFDFKPLDHLELGEKHDWIDFEGGARTTGQGFYFLKGDLVLLDFALQQYAITQLAARGFVPTITPDLARDSVLEGIGFMPRGPETQIYSVEGMDISLIGTAEITLGGLYSGKTLMVHQFTKIEMFAFTLPEQSSAMHEEIRQIECDLFDAIGVPYRIVDTATGDLGGPAYRKYDLEAWMPGRGDGGEYGEVTSTSNCTDYQARRLNIRYKEKGKKGTRFVHTLNGTAFALSRAIISVLENNQNADGSVTVPEVLRPFIGKDVIGN